MTQNLTTSVVHDVTVPLPPDKAFELFTEGLDRWWPRSHTIGTSAIKQAVVEPRAGGRWYEIGDDGSECEWGQVLAWEPPRRVVLAWQITSDWRYDPQLLTEVEATFTDRGDGTTTVSVEHRNLDRFGAGADAMRTVFSAPNGWPGLLNAYATAAA